MLEEAGLSDEVQIVERRPGPRQLRFGIAAIEVVAI